MKNNAPIGIFDSGIGGLTVTHAIKSILPNESIIYFGDTAHFPYGDKSTASIQAYSVKICNLLLEQNCKVIVIACNSASAASYELVKEYVGSKAKVINVIDPVVEYLQIYYKNKTIGLIGTKKTVGSNIYKKKIDQLNSGIKLNSLATPLLAPMIEEGFFNDNISENIIHNYLSNNVLSSISALILGCTHYPLIKKQIDEYYKNNSKIAIESIDTSYIVANYLANYLNKNSLIGNNYHPILKIYVSDYTKSYEESTKLFFGEHLPLELYPLWN